MLMPMVMSPPPVSGDVASMSISATPFTEPMTAPVVSLPPPAPAFILNIALCFSMLIAPRSLNSGFGVVGLVGKRM